MLGLNQGWSVKSGGLQLCRARFSNLLSLSSGRLSTLQSLSLLLGLTSASTLVREVGAQEVVPPSERGRVAADESLVVVVVMVSTGPEGDPVVQRDGEVVTRVSINSLEKTEHDPDIDGQDVQVLGESAKGEGTTDGTSTENENLERVGVLGSETKGSRIFVVLLVNVLVKRTPVKGTVSPVVKSILEDKEKTNLPCDLGPVWEGNLVGGKTKVFANRVEGPDLWQLDGEVREENVLGALPLLFKSRHLLVLQLVLAHRWHGVNDDPRNGTSEVNDLVDHERHDTGGNDGVAPVEIPVGPCLLEEVE